MCLLCAPSSDRVLARRNHVLQLLALVEHPDALPADMALRLAQEVLVLARADGASFQCEAVLPPQAVPWAPMMGGSPDDRHDQSDTVEAGVA